MPIKSSWGISTSAIHFCGPFEAKCRNWCLGMTIDVRFFDLGMNRVLNWPINWQFRSGKEKPSHRRAAKMESVLGWRLWFLSPIWRWLVWSLLSADFASFHSNCATGSIVQQPNRSSWFFVRDSQCRWVVARKLALPLPNSHSGKYIQFKPI